MASWRGHPSIANPVGAPQPALVSWFMGVPAFESTGMLPLGRHTCDIADFERSFVLDPRFSTSTTRAPIFSDFLSAVGFLRDQFAADLIERVWIGGGFTTSKPDPADIDVTFVLSWDSYNSLSGTQRRKLSKLLRAGGFKAIGLSVDGFMMVRERVAQPWAGAGLGAAGADYFPIRGAWDDWWSRTRVHSLPDTPPKIEDAEPVRGYMEVIV